MKNIFTLILAFFCVNSFRASEKPAAQSSTIKNVTVYLQGATIERQAYISLKGGSNEITFDNLSPDIIESSIQVSGLKNASVLSIMFNYNYLDKKKETAEYKSLEDEMDALDAKVNEIENQISGYQQELDIITKNERVNSDNTDLSLEKLKQIATYYRQRTTEIKNEIYRLRLEKYDLDKSVADLKKEMNKLNDNKKERRGEIVLKLDAESATNLDLKLSYNISNAGWFPLYDIRAKNSNSPIEVNYKANVYQQSGVDWDNVQLTLSTGDPSTNNIKPELDTKYLNFVGRYYRSSTAVRRDNHKYNPTIKTVHGRILDHNGLPLPGVNVIENGTSNGVSTDVDGDYRINIQRGKELAISYVGYQSQNLPIYASTMNVQLEQDSNTLDEVVVVGYGRQKKRSLTGAVAGIKVEQEDYSENVTAKQESLTNTKFEINKPYSIVSNGDVTTIEIDNFDLPATYKHYAAPELNENVFLTATVREWEKYDLLQGEASIYFEGNYAGKTQISPVATSDSLSLSLGVDPNIIVKRERENDFKKSTFLGNNRIVARKYTIDIKNNKSSAINLLLEDRIPISQNDDIKVSEIETGDAKYDDEDGIMQWELKLEPKQSVKKEFSYEVKYPRSKYINL